MLERQNCQTIRKNSDHDRRHTVEQICRIAHYRSYRRRTEFRQIDPAKESNRHSEQRRRQQQLRAAHYGVRHSSTRFADRRRKLGEKIPAHRSPAIKQQVPENQEKHAHTYKRAYTRHRQHEIADESSPTYPRVHQFATLLPFCVVTIISRRANPFRINVSRNNTSPSPISDCRYRSPVASVNWFAITDAIESPGENKDALI